MCSEIARSWSDNSVRCVAISCGPAPEVNHATIATSGSSFQSHAVYECEEGYTLTSISNTKQCTQDGSWSLDEVICEPIVCNSPSAPSYALINLNDSSRHSYSNGEKVTYSCLLDHLMLPASSPDSIYTTSSMSCVNGNWTMDNPSALCLPCHAPPDVSAATWYILAESPARAKYSCETGYNFTFESVDSLTCHENTRTWGENQNIRCEPVDCGEPLFSTNGTVSTSGTKYNDTASHTCNFGYIIVGGNRERSFFLKIISL